MAPGIPYAFMKEGKGAVYFPSRQQRLSQIPEQASLSPPGPDLGHWAAPS